jgi:uncharacterized protein (TIGR00661 family)
MKIFYAVTATGNGHISRAMELLPYLQKHGEVDIFLSGANSSLNIDAPVKYRSKGISLFFNSTGKLDYWKILKNLHPFDLKKEVNELPVEKYDLVINDFEYITAAACAKKKIPSVQMGHQASFQSFQTPRPDKKQFVGEWILKKLAPASHYIGIHFDRYDDFIFPPVIKKEILYAEPADKNHITVYLPSYCEPQLEKIFHSLKEFRFEIFSHGSNQSRISSNINFIPVDKKRFNESLINCTGIITGGGFETPAEALHLGKKLISIPIRGHYEQLCNAAALQKLGVSILKKVDEDFSSVFYEWINTAPVQVNYKNSTAEILEHLFEWHAKAESFDKKKSAGAYDRERLHENFVPGNFICLLK